MEKASWVMPAQALDSPRLSKSTYLKGKQCHLHLWRHFHARDLAAPADEALKLVFKTGHEVGELACRRYPGGHLIAHDHEHQREALRETRQFIDAGAAPALFEAAFEHEHVFVRSDVLERLPDGGWRLVEVKSTTRLKPVFIPDVAVQLWVLRGAGLDVREAGVLTLNRGYVYDGVRLDVNALFKLHPVLDEATALLERIGGETREMRPLLTQSEAPAVAPGEHCVSPYLCPYYAHCNQGVAGPEHGIGELPRLGKTERGKLAEAGIDEIKNIPESFPLAHLHRTVRTAVLQGRIQVHGKLGNALAAIKPPVRHLDFETFAPAIPRFAGARPYDAIPFLFSVHTEHDGRPPAHADYLHEGDDDPRPMFAERLLDALGEDGAICVYSPYERRMLRELAAAVPRRAKALAAVEARLFDLLRVVRDCCYHPDFRGSFSLKSVLPVLAPDLGYDDLAVTDGRLAAALYQRALANDDMAERQQTFAALRAYCERDTLATLEVRKALARLAGAPVAALNDGSGLLKAPSDKAMSGQARDS